MTTESTPPPAGAAGPRTLLLLAAAVVLINLPTLEQRFIPAHDSKYVFAMFSYFYQHVAAEHELPRWLAYGTYGLQAAPFQLSTLSSSSYLVMLGGAVLGVQDSLCLFKLSILGEQLLFLLGVYLLARRLYANPLTVFIIGFCAAFGTVWYWQLFFNFRIFHLLPLALYFLSRFTGEKRPQFLWLAGLTFILGMLGTPLYFYPLQALAFALVCLGLGSVFRSALPSLRERSWQNAAALGAFLAAAAAIGLTLHHAFDGMRVFATQRDDGGKVALESFLTYGGLTTPQILTSFLGALPEPSGNSAGEATHFIGLLPLAAFAAALPRCRNPYFIALSAAGGLILLLSMGGTFASLVYRIPLMGFFRHIGHLSALANPLLLLAAGFGIDRLLARLDAGIEGDRAARFGLLAVVLLGLWFVADLQLSGVTLILVLDTVRSGAFGAEPFAAGLSVVVRVLAYLGAAAVVLWPARGIPARSAFGPGITRRALLAAVLVDGILFQGLALSRMPRTEEPLALPSGPLAWQRQRDEPLTAQTGSGLKEWRQSGVPGAEYHLAICSAFRRDPSQPLARQDLMPDAVATLMDARSSLKPDPQLQAVLGVTAPKLRLVPGAVYVDDPAEARKQVAESRSLDTQVVLRGVPEGQRFAGVGASGEVVVKEFSANRLVAEVPLSGPAWLVYADALHPGWSASVNGKPVPVVEAYLAFKAVRLDAGVNVVRFSFRDGAGTLGQQSLALLPLLCGLAGLAAVLRRRSASQIQASARAAAASGSGPLP